MVVDVLKISMCRTVDGGAVLVVEDMLMSFFHTRCLPSLLNNGDGLPLHPKPQRTKSNNQSVSPAGFKTH
jgi:hypothetical protein